MAFWWLKKLKRPIYGRFQGFETIQALCRLPYLVVDEFQKAQYLVVFFFLFHVFYCFGRAEVGFLLALVIHLLHLNKLQSYLSQDCSRSVYAYSSKPESGREALPPDKRICSENRCCQNAQTHRKTIRQHHYDNRRTRLSGTNRWYELPYYDMKING